MSFSPLRFLATLLLGSALGLSAACSAGGGKPVDAAIFDVPQDLSLGELPPGCPPEKANDLGVGKVCTAGGGQCAGNGTATQCTCDKFLGLSAPQGTPCFCTSVGLLACPAQSTCGTDATCCAYTSQGTAIGHLCVPTICLAEQVCPPYLNQ